MENTNQFGGNNSQKNITQNLSNDFSNFNLILFIIGAGLFILLTITHYLILPNVIEDYNIKTFKEKPSNKKIDSFLKYILK